MKALCTDCIAAARFSVMDNLRDEASEQGVDFWDVAVNDARITEIARGYVASGDSACSAHS